MKEGEKKQSALTKPKVDRKNYMFVNQKGQELMKKPGEINGQAFKLENLEDCVVYLLDHFAQIYMDNCKDCKIAVGAIKSSIQVRKCTGCTISACCQQFRCTDIHNCAIFVCVNSQPTIEASTDLTFAPYNVGYPGLDEHIKSAGIDAKRNLWKYVHDMTPKPDEVHWKLLSPTAFFAITKNLEGSPEPSLLVPIPIRYGGAQKEEEETVLEESGEGFSIATTKEEAKTQMKVLEKVDAPEEKSIADSLAGLSLGNDVEAKSGKFSTGFSFGSSDEDMELINKRAATERARMQALSKKYEDEQKKKAERMEKGATELDDWKENWRKTIEKKKEKNRELQKIRENNKAAISGEKNAWEKVVSNIDTKEGIFPGTKDLARMKQVMLSRKGDKK